MLCFKMIDSELICKFVALSIVKWLVMCIFVNINVLSSHGITYNILVWVLEVFRRESRVFILFVFSLQPMIKENGLHGGSWVKFYK